MKMGFDISDLATGRADGTTRYTYELARRLPELGKMHEWNYFTPAPLALGFDDMPSSTKLHISPWPKYWTQLRLPGELYRYQPEVLFMPIQQLPLLRPKKTRTVAVIHDLAVHYYPEQFTYKDWLLLHIFSANAARYADHLIAVSQATAADIEKFYGRTRNVHVIHHGINHAEFYNTSHNERVRNLKHLIAQYPQIQDPYILYLGQLQPRKNIARLVAAFNIVAQTDCYISLVIAGGHGWMQDSIMAAINSSPVHHRIHLLDAVPQQLLPALYQNAQAYVLPSLYEGFGLPILEAMACGTPVVTSNISCMPEVVGNAAVLVNPLDANDIATGIIEARHNAAIYTRRGLARAQAFSWDSTAKQTLAVLTSTT